jgi:cytochrome c peroxidase
MTNAPIPPTPGLLDGADPIVVNKNVAIALGKALFWDTNVGSDGMACASCHFHAGADRRIKNQLNPGDKSSTPSGQTFDTTASGAIGGPNYSLSRADFPFFQFQNPLSTTSPIIFESDDVASSSGTFSGQFNNVSRYSIANDDCTRSPDQVFHVGTTGTRRVEPRHTPTVINAVFYHRNFWDGRANNIFNGSSMWGNRDPNAGVWVKTSSRAVQKQRLELINSSLASQAMAPPLSDTEMGCQQRSFPALARKILSRRPLENQKVHWNDSVLGSISRSTATQLNTGLNTVYRTMIRQAFNRKYWSYSHRGQFGSLPNQTPDNQMEANFSLFFGLAIQLYESTLISDQARIDTAPRGTDFKPTTFSQSELNGMQLFEDFHCNICHDGPALSAAAIVTNAMMLEADEDAFGPHQSVEVVKTSRNIVNRDGTNLGNRLIDFGYFNTGVADPESDPGVAGIDDFGNPLSFTAQYTQLLAGNTSAVLDSGVDEVRACNFQSFLARDVASPALLWFTQADGILPEPQGLTGCLTPFAFIPTPAAAANELTDPNTKKMAVAIQAAFKSPTLRNVELTGPYMHNGSMATLEEVVEFYMRGGNVLSNNTHTFQFNHTTTAQDRADIVAFLKTFTDERVRFERAPFDHPEISIPNGHSGDHQTTVSGNPLHQDLAIDEMLTIPAVGANGLTSPILPFDSYLP